MKQVNEIRCFDTKMSIEQRGEGDKKISVLVGHAAVFNSLSADLGGFRERIEHNAFDNVMGDDVRAVFNHDPNIVLGRTKSKTLRLTIDTEGLNYEIDLPDTQQARDLAVSVARGDIDGSSFKFRVLEDKWEMNDEGQEVRVIINIGRLLDVGPVTFPAYADATVAKRSLEDFKSKNDGQAHIDRLNLELLKKAL